MRLIRNPLRESSVAGLQKFCEQFAGSVKRHTWEAVPNGLRVDDSSAFTESAIKQGKMKEPLFWCVATLCRDGRQLGCVD